MLDNSIGDNMKKISVKTLYLLAIISIGLISLGVGSTFAMFTATVNLRENINIAANLDYTSNIIELVEIDLEPNLGVQTITTGACNQTDTDLNIVVWYQDEEGVEVAFGQGDQVILEDKYLTANYCGQFDLEFINKSGENKRIVIGVSGSTDNVVLSPKMKPVLNNLNLSLAEKIRFIYEYGTETAITDASGIGYGVNSSAKLIDVNADRRDIRYYGATPDNYIKFNCTEYPDTNCETWRIIGIVDGKAKLIRGSSIGNYSWDSSEGTISSSGSGTEVMGNSSYNDNKVKFLDNNIYDTKAIPIAAANDGNGINEWSRADIMKVLNPGYESNIDTTPVFNNGSIVRYMFGFQISNSLYYNSGRGSCYNGNKQANTLCDFGTVGRFVGIKNDTTKSKIAEVTYFTGGIPSTVFSLVESYRAERSNLTVSNPSDGITRTTTWTGRIALPYPSDYGYATDLSLCNSAELLGFSDSTCKSNNWMYGIFGTSTATWLLNPKTATAYDANFVESSGSISNRGLLLNGVSTPFQIFPVLYLNDDVIIESGTGTSSDPYTIKP